ncbi:MAG: T9SS type A sorting domain-containing protein, partial [Ignavibacteriae bacterium]|nr:T9SS type A sorting domain-containing protein [Ignavibacteriota bacterium]
NCVCQTQFQCAIGGTSIERAFSIIKTTDGGYAIAGTTGSYGTGSSDMYIVKLNSSGMLQWSKTVGGDTTDNAYSIIQTTDGGYAIAGYTNSFGAGSNDMYIVKFDEGWNTCGNTSSFASSSGTGGTTTSPTPTVTSPTLTVISPSPTIGSGGTVTIICTLVGIKKLEGELPQEYKLEQNFPNPFNPSTIIRFQIKDSRFVSLKVYDILGKEIETLVNEIQKPGVYEINFPNNSLTNNHIPSGIYFYRLIVVDPLRRTGDYSETKRMILLK